MRSGISTYCTPKGLCGSVTGYVGHLAFVPAQNPPGRVEDNGAARWTTIKVYDTSTSVEIMDNGDIVLGQKLAIIQESSRKADLSKTERGKKAY